MKFKKSEKALYKHAIQWYLERMGMEDANIKVEVEYSPLFYGRMAMKNRKKGWLLLSIETDPYTRLSTLFHELTHAHQFYRGDLDLNCRWKGKSYRRVDYDAQPWEVEAHAVEGVLTELYLKECWND